MIHERSPLSMSTPKLDGFLSVSPFSFTKNISFESLFSSEVSPCHLANVLGSISPSSLPTPTLMLEPRTIQIQPQAPPKLQPLNFQKLKEEKYKRKAKVAEVIEDKTVNTTKTPKQMTTTTNFVSNPELKRKWNVVFMEERLAQNNISVEVTSKTRCEEPNAEVPDTLYSSLKYEIAQKFISNNCSEQFVLSRISVVDASNGIVLSKSMKGVTECSLTKSENSYQGTLKCQFADLAHYNKKSDLCWEINYYLPSNIQKSVLRIRSAPFKVFARKPTVKKRKASQFDEFLDRLDELVKASKKLKEQDKKLALEMVTSKFNDIVEFDFIRDEESDEENQ